MYTPSPHSLLYNTLPCYSTLFKFATMPAAIQSPALPSEVLMIAETQWLFTEAELQQTPTIIAGLPLETERENRSKGVNFILQVGIMLKLPQITLATASVFLHRFYMRHPMKWPENPHGFHHYEYVAWVIDP